MAGEDKVLMSVKALWRLHGIHRVMGKKLGQVEAARLPGLTDRQILRIVRTAVPQTTCVHPDLVEG